MGASAIIDVRRWYVYAVMVVAAVNIRRRNGRMRADDDDC